MHGGNLRCAFSVKSLTAISSHKIYEDDDFIAILDIAQSTIGHALIITKNTMTTSSRCRKRRRENSGALAVKLANHINGVLGAGNMNLLNNAGPWPARR